MAVRQQHLKSIVADTVLGSIAGAFLAPLVMPRGAHWTVQMHVEAGHISTGPRFSYRGRRHGHGHADVFVAAAAARGGGRVL